MLFEKLSLFQLFPTEHSVMVKLNQSYEIFTWTQGFYSDNVQE